MLAFLALFDLVMEAFRYDQVSYLIANDRSKNIIYWTIIGYNIVKLVIVALAYLSFKKAFMQQGGS